jgi:hypothetical protein
MIVPDELSELTKSGEKKAGEEEMDYLQRLAMITARKLASTVKKAAKPKKKNGEKKEEENNNPGDNLSGSIPQEYLTSIDNIKKIEVSLIKDYINLSATKMAAKTSADKERLDISVKSAETALIEAGLSLNDIRYLDYKTREILKRIFILAVKDRFIISLNSPKDMSEYLVKTDKPVSAIDYLSFLEKDFVNITDIAGLMKKYSLDDIFGISDFIQVNRNYWIDSFKKENIGISNIEDFYKKYSAVLPVANFSPGVSSLRSLSVELYLSEGFFKRISISQKVRKQVKNLIEMGLAQKDVEDIRSQGRRIAWLKTISSLKEQHLKRILTSSTDDFENESIKIEKLTKKARGLGYDIPAEGIKWINTGLAQLAYNSASYKAELLRSMQQMAFEAQREKDIKHLDSILASLKNRAKE